MTGKEQSRLPRILFGTAGIKRDPYIYSASETPRNVSPFERMQGFYRLIKSGAIEVFETNHELVAQLISERSKTPFTTFQILLDIGHRAVRLEIGERASNGLRNRMLDTDRDVVYGHPLAHARENPTLKDHAHDHERHVKRYIRLLFLSSEDNLIEYPEMIDALGLFPTNHDEAQLMAALWNRQHIGQEISTKFLHGEFASAILSTKVMDYALERHISIERAQRSINVAKLLILTHANPSVAKLRLYGSKKAYGGDGKGKYVPISTEDLIEAWRNNTLDITSMSDSQLFSIIELERSKTTDVHTTETGLHPMFEDARRDVIMERMKDTTPWFVDVSDDYRRVLEQALNIALAADLIPMVFPTEPAILRKLNVDQATKRPLFSPSNPHEFVTAVFGLDGGSLPSDFHRTMWEYASLVNTIVDMGFDENSYVFQKMRELIIFGILETRTTFKKLMNGEAGLVFVKDSMLIRIKQLGIKALRKSGLRTRSLNDAQTVLTKLTTPEEIHSFISEQLTTARRTKHVRAKKYLTIFHQKFHHMQIETLQTIDRLRRKPNNIHGNMRVYDQEAYVNVDDCVNPLLDRVGEIFELTPMDITKMVKRWQLGARSNFPGVGTYDSLGIPSHARTLIRPPDIRTAILNTIDLGEQEAI